MSAPEHTLPPAAAPGARLVYLDNSATSYPKPPEVIAAVKDCLDHSLTVARSTHIAPFRGDEVLRRTRAKLAHFFNAALPEEMIYTYSATDGLNIAIHGMVQPGGHMLVSPLEHHSVMRPLHHLRETQGVTWTELPADGGGVVDVDSVKRLVQPNTCALIINWVSNVTGTVQPVAELGRVARELGLPYLVDAAQATGTHPVDVQAIGCDAMAQPGHKALMSLPGMGVLYVRQGADLAPWRSGGTGYRSDLAVQPEELPMRYESGTPNVPGIVALDAALDWFARVGLSAVQARCAALVARLYEGLAGLPGLALIGPPPSLERGHVVSFTLDDARGAPVDPLVVSQLLAERYGVSSRAGLHCAPTAHRHFGTYDRGGTVRFSVGYFTTDEEADYAVAAVRDVAREVR
jgi:cysteine desulfurase / selenocysteine lyase